MNLVVEYETAVRDAERARVHRILAMRAMLANGVSQRELASRLGVTQPAISYQVAPERTKNVRPSELISAGGSVFRQIAESRGFTNVAVFGSTARGDDRPDSDIDMLVQPPAGAGMFDMIHLEEMLSLVAGRPVDLISYGGLDLSRDADIRRDSVLL